MAAIDPGFALQAALTFPNDSIEQIDSLKVLRAVLENEPQRLQQFLPPLLETYGQGADSILKRWVLDLLLYSLNTPTLSIDVRSQIASDSLPALAQLIAIEQPIAITKAVILCFSSSYSLVFRLQCSPRTSNNIHWSIMTLSRDKILEMLGGRHPEAISANKGQHVGIQIAAVKFVQRVILVHAPLVTDPRLQNRADPNVSMLPMNHPFINGQQMEVEGIEYLQRLMTLMYKSSDPNVVTSIISTIPTLAKSRPALVDILVRQICEWRPLPAMSISVSPSTLRSVEKSAYLVLNHVLKLGIAARWVPTLIKPALEACVERIHEAARLQHQQKVNASTQAQSRKRDPVAPADAQPASKRVKTEDTGAATAPPGPLAPLPPALSNFDFRELPGEIVTQLVLANLAHFSDAQISGAIQRLRQTSPTVTEDGVTRAKIEVDEEEMEFEPDEINRQLQESGIELEEDDEAMRSQSELIDEADDDLALSLASSPIELYAPGRPSPLQTEGVIVATLSRLSDMHIEPAESQPISREDGDERMESDVDRSRQSATADLPPLLMLRIVTRGLTPKGLLPPTDSTDSTALVPSDGGAGSKMIQRANKMRQSLVEHIANDFQSRHRIAVLWMNEEWLNDSLSTQSSQEVPNYKYWLMQLITTYQSSGPMKDSVLAEFLLGVPFLPKSVFEFLAKLCEKKETVNMGLETLRELIQLRAPVRPQAMNILLRLTTHSETSLRVAAIKWARRWVPDVEPMFSMIKDYAISLLRRLASIARHAPDSTSEEERLKDNTFLPTEGLSETSLTPQILQHVQLSFALCAKAPELVDQVFQTYGELPPNVQTPFLEQFVPVIRSIGTSVGNPSYIRLLEMIENFPPAAESLALRSLKVLTADTRPPSQLVAAVKSLMEGRSDVDARFIIPIMGELNKDDIIHQIPRVVSMLTTNQGEARPIVKSMFMSIVEDPGTGFGTASTNVKRVRESQLLKPVELLVLLHDASKGFTVRDAREAIDICFGLPAQFPSEVLAAAIHQMVDEPTLPALYMRTVIQAVRMYKSLIPFVAGQLMTRLIQKKIWTLGPLWDGFVICAKLIAPASYPSLLLLPSQQLADVAEKQATLRTGLREYVIRKGGNTSKYLDVLGREPTPVPNGSPHGDAPPPIPPSQAVAT